MSGQDAPDPIADAVLAAQLFLADPARFGGLCLRGASPARDRLVAALGEAIALRRMPGNIDDERLIGGLDLAASLAAGRSIDAKGLLEEAQGGALIVPMAERIEPGIAGRLAQALDMGAGPALVLLDDSADPDDAPPASLAERCAFHCDLSHSRWNGPLMLDPSPGEPIPGPLDDKVLARLAGVATALGIDSVRALIAAEAAARAHAALEGRSEADEEDCAAAVRLVLAPRATRIPEMPGETEEAPDPQEPPDPQETPESSEPQENSSPEDENEDAPPPAPDGEIEERLVEAAQAAIPADLLAMLAKGHAPRRITGGGTGRRRKSGLRGKPLGATSGQPRGGARLALIDTMRAAVPWQKARRRELEGTAGAPSTALLVQKQDLRVRRFEDKAARLTIFAVDASGSAAAARLAEAKGAVELLLAQAYVTRSEVALIAFRGSEAPLCLAPTRSLTRARRVLGEVPGGGGTPLALGLDAAFECAQTAIRRGRTPSLVVLTDGRANIARDGTAGRKAAAQDAIASARAIARAGLDGIVIDISARAGPEGAALADAMGARYLAMPRADARTISAAIEPIGKAA